MTTTCSKTPRGRTVPANRAGEKSNRHLHSSITGEEQRTHRQSATQRQGEERERNDRDIQRKKETQRTQRTVSAPENKQKRQIPSQWKCNDCDSGFPWSSPVIPFLSTEIKQQRELCHKRANECCDSCWRRTDGFAKTVLLILPTAPVRPDRRASSRCATKASSGGLNPTPQSTSTVFS